MTGGSIWIYRISALSVCLTLACAASQSNAAERPPMFAHGMARDVLTAEVCKSQAVGMEYFLSSCGTTLDLDIPEEDPNAAQAPAAALAAPGAAKIAQSPEELLAKYGDPTQDQPIVPVETAPKSFKALTEALQLGDTEMAYQYAKQYVRYQNSVKDNSMRVMGLVGKAMKQQGMLPENSWADNKQFDEYNTVADADSINKLLPDEQNAPELASLPPEARELLNRATAEEEELANGQAAGMNADVIDEKSGRARVRSMLAGRVPQSSDGKVEVYYFFRFNDIRARQTLFELNRVHKDVGADGRINILAFTTDVTSPDAIAKFQRTTGISLPIKNGGELARRLQITQSPTSVFAANGNDNMLREVGMRKGWYFDEVIKMMQGA